MRRVGNVLERYRTRVPASRFIHVDVFYERLPVRGDSPLGNVVITGLPEVTIVRGERESDDWVPRTPESEQISASIEERVWATLFRDFLFLLRVSQRHEELKEATETVAKSLRSKSPVRVGLATRFEGGRRELARVDKALVKHVLLGDYGQKQKPIAEYLTREWLTRYAQYLNALSRNIVLFEEYWRQTQSIAYAVDGTIRIFAKVSNPEGEEKKLLEKKLAPESKLIMRRLTPSLEVPLPNPPRPECCEYRDFSKGISELVWQEPEDGGPLQHVALVEGADRYYAVHAQASKGFDVRSVRMDHGFVGMLNGGSLKVVRVTGLREE